MSHKIGFSFVVVKVGAVPMPFTEDGDTLRILQKHVGDGLIETAARKRIREKGPDGEPRNVCLDAYANEEGLMLGLPGNRLIDGQPIVGDIVISGADEETGEAVSLSPAELVAALTWAKSWPVAINVFG